VLRGRISGGSGNWGLRVMVWLMEEEDEDEVGDVFAVTLLGVAIILTFLVFLSMLAGLCDPVLSK